MDIYLPDTDHEEEEDGVAEDQSEHHSEANIEITETDTLPELIDLKNQLQNDSQFLAFTKTARSSGKRRSSVKQKKQRSRQASELNPDQLNCTIIKKKKFLKFKSNLKLKKIII